MRLRVNHDIETQLANLNPPNTLFNLSVKDLETGAIETYLNVSITAGHPRFVTDVLHQQSRLLRGVASYAALPAPNTPAPAGTKDPFDHTSATALTGGDDGNAVGADQITDLGLSGSKHGLYALEKADLFNLLVIPPFSDTADVDKTSWAQSSPTRRSVGQWCWSTRRL